MDGLIELALSYPQWLSCDNGWADGFSLAVTMWLNNDHLLKDPEKSSEGQISW